MGCAGRAKRLRGSGGTTEPRVSDKRGRMPRSECMRVEGREKAMTYRQLLCANHGVAPLFLGCPCMLQFMGFGSSIQRGLWDAIFLCTVLLYTRKLLANGASVGYNGKRDRWAQNKSPASHNKLSYLSSPCFCAGAAGGCENVWVGKGAGVEFVLGVDLVPLFAFIPPGGGGIENAE